MSSRLLAKMGKFQHTLPNFKPIKDELDSKRFGNPKLQLEIVVEKNYRSDVEQVMVDTAEKQLLDAGYLGDIVLTEKGYLLRGEITGLKKLRGSFDIKVDDDIYKLTIRELIDKSKLVWMSSESGLYAEVDKLFQRVGNIVLNTDPLSQLVSFGDWGESLSYAFPQANYPLILGTQSTHAHLENGRTLNMIRMGNGFLINDDTVQYYIWDDLFVKPLERFEEWINPNKSGNLFSRLYHSIQNKKEMKRENKMRELYDKLKGINSDSDPLNLTIQSLEKYGV